MTAHSDPPNADTSQDPSGEDPSHDDVHSDALLEGEDLWEDDIFDEDAFMDDPFFADAFEKPEPPPNLKAPPSNPSPPPEVDNEATRVQSIASLFRAEATRTESQPVPRVHTDPTAVGPPPQQPPKPVHAPSGEHVSWSLGPQDLQRPSRSLYDTLDALLEVQLLPFPWGTYISELAEEVEISPDPTEKALYTHEIASTLRMQSPQWLAMAFELDTHAHDLNPTFKPALRALGATLLCVHTPAQALPFFDRSLHSEADENDPLDVDLYIETALLNEYAQHPDRAARLYQTILERSPSSLSALLRLCRSLPSSLSTPPWIQALTSDSNPSRHVLAARIARAQHDVKSALQYALHASTLDPQIVRPEHLLGFALNASDLSAEASQTAQLSGWIGHFARSLHAAPSLFSAPPSTRAAESRIRAAYAHIFAEEPTHTTLQTLLQHLPEPNLHAVWNVLYAQHLDDPTPALLRSLDLAPSLEARFCLALHALRNQRDDNLTRAFLTPPEPSEDLTHEERAQHARDAHTHALVLLNLLDDPESAASLLVRSLHHDPSYTPALYTLSALCALPYSIHTPTNPPQDPLHAQRAAWINHLHTHNPPDTQATLTHAYLDGFASHAFEACAPDAPHTQLTALQYDPNSAPKLRTLLQRTDLTPPTRQRALLWSTVYSPTEDDGPASTLTREAPHLICALPAPHRPTLAQLQTWAPDAPYTALQTQRHYARRALSIDPLQDLETHSPNAHTDPLPPLLQELLCTSSPNPLQTLANHLDTTTDLEHPTPHATLRSVLLAAELLRDHTDDLDRSLSLFQHALTLDPANICALRAVLSILHQTQRFEALHDHIQHWINLLPTDPHPTRTHLVLALAYLNAHHLQRPLDAATLYEEALQHLDPTSDYAALSLFSATQLHLHHSPPTTAQRWLHRFADGLPHTSDRLDTLLFTASFERSHNLPTRSTWEHILRLQPDHDEAQRGLETALTADQDHDALLALYAGQLNHTPRHDAEMIRFKMAHLLTQLDRPEAAVDLLVDTLDTHPDHIPSLLLLARAQASLHRWADALTTETALSSLAPQDSLRIAHLYNRAVLLQDHLDQPTQAQNLLTSILELDPTHTGAFDRLHTLFEHDPQHRTSLIDLLESRIAVSPPDQHPALLHRIADLCDDHTQRRDTLNRALSINPRDPHTLTLLASTCEDLNDPQTALQHLHTLLELNPTHTQTLLHIATLYTNTAQPNHALQHLQTLLELDPTHTDALQLLATVHLDLDDPQAALQTTLDLFEVQPSTHTAQRIAHITTHHLSTPHRALPWLSISLDLDPTDVNPLRTLARSSSPTAQSILRTRLPSLHNTLVQRIQENPWDLDALRALQAISEPHRAHLLGTLLHALNLPHTEPLQHHTPTPPPPPDLSSLHAASLSSAQHTAFSILAKLLVHDSPDPFSPQLQPVSLLPPRLQHLLETLALQDTVQIFQHPTDLNAVYTLFSPVPTLVLGTSVLSDPERPTHLFLIGFALESLRSHKAILQRPNTPAHLSMCNDLLHNVFGALLPTPLYDTHEHSLDFEPIRAQLTPTLRRDLLRAIHLPHTPHQRWTQDALFASLRLGTLLCNDAGVALQCTAPLLAPFAPNDALQNAHTALISTPPEQRNPNTLRALFSASPLLSHAFNDLVLFLALAPIDALCAALNP